MDLPKIGKPAPIFRGKAVLNNQIVDISSDDYKNKYIILLFYPMNFAYVCPTELIAFSDKLNEFTELNTSIVACSIESPYTHLKWLGTPQKEGGIRGLRFPLIADKSMSITKAFGVLKEDEGMPYRGMFIIDDKGILRQITINDRPVGRSVYEAHRLVKAIQHAVKLRESTSLNGFVEVVPESSIQKSRSFLCNERSLVRDLTE